MEKKNAFWSKKVVKRRPRDIQKTSIFLKGTSHCKILNIPKKNPEIPLYSVEKSQKKFPTPIKTSKNSTHIPKFPTNSPKIHQKS
jgi:hypothetical protein